HHHRLSRLGRGDDETALALADRRDQVDDACGQHVRLGLQPQALLRVERNRLGKFLALLGLVRGHTVHRVQPHQGVELLATLTLAGLADRADDVVALAQAVLANLGQRDVDVALAGQVTGGANEGVVVQDVEDPGNRQKDVVLGDHRFGFLASSPAVTAITAPSPSAAATGIVVAVPALALAAPALLLIVVLVVAAATAAATAAAVAVTSITLAFSPLSGAVSVPAVGGGGSALLGGARCRRHGCLVGPACCRPARGDHLALSHTHRSGDAQARCELLRLGELQSREPGSARRRAGPRRRCALWRCLAGLRSGSVGGGFVVDRRVRVEFGGIAH